MGGGWLGEIGSIRGIGLIREMGGIGENGTRGGLSEPPLRWVGVRWVGG